MSPFCVLSDHGNECSIISKAFDQCSEYNHSVLFTKLAKTNLCIGF